MRHEAVHWMLWAEHVQSVPAGVVHLEHLVGLVGETLGGVARQPAETVLSFDQRAWIRTV